MMRFRAPVTPTYWGSKRVGSRLRWLVLHRLAHRFPVAARLDHPPLRDAAASRPAGLAAPGDGGGGPRAGLDEARGGTPNMARDGRATDLRIAGLAEAIGGEDQALQDEVPIDREAAIDYDPSADQPVGIDRGAVADADRRQIGGGCRG